MTITLKYFASVREAVGMAQEAFALPEGAQTVGGVREALAARGGVWAETLDQRRPVRMAYNQVMCGPETVVADGSEVAFFPPVTGG